MTGRLQLIEQKLIAIDPAGFQNLCDAYLLLREEEYANINRTGSQLGKQKTISGTPDSFIRLESKRLALIEYTTQTDSITKKIKDDIDKCISGKISVPAEDIHQIIICFNSRLKIEEEIEIQTYAEYNEIQVVLIGIDNLALEILSKYFILSRDILGIPIDTGQILPLDTFILEYNNKAKQLSTPLNNVFLSREKELEEIYQNLKSNDFIILSGTQGVGKTKLGIEVIYQFIENHSDYTSYVIAKKDVDIYEDLRIQIQHDKNYILLIDDANRQLSNLQQILGVFKEIRTGIIKIILTVRSYALSDIYKVSSGFENHTINIDKFSDQEIIDIISSESFNILNNKFQKKIIDIADGNVRLAVMAARIANEKQGEFLWGDVSDLFDSYFENFLSDFDLFENKSVLKTLGIISFFYTISRDDKPFIHNLLKLFEIDYYEFNEAVEELHKRELIEVQYNHARISEQVMATYFFYKVFIKDGLLSFKILLFNYFSDWRSRFKDSIIPANNSFGYENVITKIDGILSEYLQSIKDDEKKTLDFLDLFWFYKPHDTISYFHQRISELPEPVSLDYKTEYEINDFVFDREQTLDFLTRFFNHYTEWYRTTIELAFEFVRKKPENLPEFIRRIRENLMFDEPDEGLGFKRQIDFADILIANFNKGKLHYIVSFFPLVKFFLKHSFDVTHGGRKHTITWYDYPLPCDAIIKDLRSTLWNTLFDNYEKFPDQVLDVIKSFKPAHRKLVPQLMDFDLGLLVPFISEEFSPMNFEHTHYVNNFIFWNDREKEISDRSYRELKSRYTTNEYRDYCILSWDRLRDKHEFDYNDLKEYDNLKAEEIRKSFLFKSQKEFDRLFAAITNIVSVSGDNLFSAGQSIDIVIEENFNRNNDLGFCILQRLFDEYPKGLQLLYRSISTITKRSKEWCLKLWDEIENWNDEHALFWKTNFFNYIPDEFINKFYRQKLIETIVSIDRYTYLYIEIYKKFALDDAKMIHNLFATITKKIDALDIVIAYSDDIYTNDLSLFNSDYELIKKSYFQQYRINHSQIFDFKGEGFEAIFNLYPKFLIDFLANFFIDNSVAHRDREIPVSFIWDSDKNKDIIEESFNLIIDRNPYVGIGDHAVSIFFKELIPLQMENAISFLKYYIGKNNENDYRINMIFEAIRTGLNSHFEELLLFYLSSNQDIEKFKAIDWVGNVGGQVGEVIFGDLYAKKWEQILNIVNKSENSLEMIPIQSFLKNKILEQYKWAESERKRRYIQPDR